MLTNRPLSAEEAREWGIVTRVIEMTIWRRRPAGWRPSLLPVPHGPMAVKRLLATSFQQSVEAQMEDETRIIAELAQTEDGREGLDAFLNKRKPVFKGR